MSAPWIAAFAALWLLVLVSIAVELGFLRRATLVLERVEVKLSSERVRTGASPGQAIAPFEARDREGALVDSQTLTRSRGVYVFLESGCEPCRRLVAELGDGAFATDGLPLYVVMDDSEAGRRIGLPDQVHVLYESGRDVSEAFNNLATPQAYVVDAGGVVRDSVVPSSWKSIETLVARSKGGDGEKHSGGSEAT